MDNIRIEDNFSPAYARQEYGDYRQQSGANLGAGPGGRPGVPFEQLGYSPGLISDVTSTAGYTLSGANDPQQEQNMQIASQELTKGMCA